ncbi:MAG: hypothetical protein A3F14_05670 [Gammaproteobacteria bacterium RIFCSPHIGHO2_12_FULL_43_28]|nr:MAG: hypothetical protein A3F14_05670 [Gammaproteobacteria bacterium RIFCSPHIGHO2_12_FULL_43_28]
MQPINVPIYQAAQIRELEKLAIAKFNLSSQTMMQRAGKAASEFLLRRWPQVKRVAIFCGSGNNGGDGYVLAKLLHERGMDISVWQVGNHDALSEVARDALDACKKDNVPVNPFSEAVDLVHPDLIVDAICGIGLHDQLRKETMAAIDKMHRSHAPIFSIDIPTGIDADTGNVLGKAVRASATITFIGLKLGLLTGSGIAYTGELVLNDLQFPAELLNSVKPIAEKLQLGAFASLLKPRTRDWHKGMSGHVLIVGGYPGYSGAPRMAAEAALRIGAGLVSVATHPEHAASLNAFLPEIMCHGIHTPDDLSPLIERADVIVFGPGLSQTSWAKLLFTKVYETALPLVVDADGLNLLATDANVRENWVLTPHPGEAARLLNESTEVIQQDRLLAVNTIQQRYGGVCVLKGAGTLISAPPALPALCNKGNPGMASAGMGDVLSGVIGGLIAQKIPLGDAAKLGVYIHAMAGDLAAKEGERGMIATDLMPYLRRLNNSMV